MPTYNFEDILKGCLQTACNCANAASSMAEHAASHAGHNPSKLRDAAQAALAATEAQAAVARLIVQITPVPTDDMGECRGCENCKPSVN